MDYNVSKIIIIEYFRSKIFENSTYRDYVMEEFFIFSYLTSKYVLKNVLKTLCFFYIETSDYRNSNNKNFYIQENYNKLLYDGVISIKPVNRNSNDPIRKFLIEKLIFLHG